jgi:selenocysteine lyase/cysteine desulfurase
LKRTSVGWRQTVNQRSHVDPFDPPGPAIGDWGLGFTTAAKFEVSTPSWITLAMAAASIDYVTRLGVARIAAYRKPLIARLQEELPKRGFAPMTPWQTQGPIVTFAYRDAQKKLEPVLKAANIKVQLGDNRIRISPSVYNDMSDIDRLLQALPKA